jgi:predicted enzyme related to lactoylglutathione lyase
MSVAYLEIVSPHVDATCAMLSAIHGVTFSDPVPTLGLARTAPLPGGGRWGVRAPMRDDEAPVQRTYTWVDDIHAATVAVTAAGALVALPPMELPGEGTIAIYIHEGVEHGLWQRRLNG